MKSTINVVIVNDYCGLAFYLTNLILAKKQCIFCIYYRHMYGTFPYVEQYLASLYLYVLNIRDIIYQQKKIK